MNASISMTVARRTAAGLTTGLLLWGCTVGPAYEKPVTQSPAAFRFASDSNAAFPPADWWTLFEDNDLNGHVSAVLAANQDLTLAIARFDESRALLGVARADELPAVGFDPSYTKARTSADISNRVPVLATAVWRVPVDLAYEIDFWGRVRNSVAAARAQLQGSADAVAALRLSLAAETTVTYLLLCSYDREIAVLKQTVTVREEALQLATRRAAVGTVGDIDVVRARADLALTRADVQDVQRRRAITEHALAVLENSNAPDFAVPARTRLPTIPEIPAGLPSQLLERRPDVAQRERALAAAVAQIGVAEASFFPTVRLTASGGVASNDLATLFKEPSLIGSIGPSVTLPIFDGGRNRSTLEAVQARYREALATYRSGVLTAFRETQDSLSDVAYLRGRGGDLREAVVASTQAAAISRSRYDRGLAGYFEVVDSERAALANRRAEIQNDQQRLSAAVSLFKALGGGWTAETPIPALPAEPAPGQLPPLPTALSVR